MNLVAIRHANQRLATAGEAMEELKLATTLEATEVAWSKFLVAAMTIYTKLEQGSKTAGVSAAWFGRKKHVRKTDELLCYIHQARNADEHGLAEITDRKAGGWGIGGAGSYLLNGVIDGSATSLIVSHISGRPPELIVIKPAVELVPVVNLGKTYHPPSMHLGNKLSDVSPANVAGLALDYLRIVLQEASAL